MCLLALSAQSLSQTDAKDRIDVSLVSIGPGQTYWQRFGHNAILIKVRGDAEDPGVMYPGVMYNYFFHSLSSPIRPPETGILFQEKGDNKLFLY